MDKVDILLTILVLITVLAVGYFVVVEYQIGICERCYSEYGRRTWEVLELSGGQIIDCPSIVETCSTVGVL